MLHVLKQTIGYEVNNQSRKLRAFGIICNSLNLQLNLLKRLPLIRCGIQSAKS